MSWFEVDKAGLAAVLARRGKSFALFELVQNAWDAGAKNVEIQLEPLAGSPYATLVVTDDATEGWADLSEAFTMFSRSRRASDPLRRGRFCLGEKLVLSICREAKIVTTSGAVAFDSSGRRRVSQTRDQGTCFEGEIRLTRDELAEVSTDALRLIPPAGCITLFNGQSIQRPHSLKVFEAKLPTEVADTEGNLRRTVRGCHVEAFAADSGEILEMGIPVCQADWPWRLNVQQKVPLGMERDTVTDAFRRALQIAAVNALAETLDEEQATQPWANEAISDSRIAVDALRSLVTTRFGERAVVAVPGDPMANAKAEALGSTVLHGGSLSAGAWANVRKHALLPTTSQAFPTPRPSPEGNQIEFCPLCKQRVNG